MLWIGLGIILFCVILLCSRIYIDFTFTYQQDKQLINVTVRLYGISLIRRAIDLEEMENQDLWKNPFKGKTFTESLKHIDNILRSIFETIDNLTMAARIFLRRLRVKKIDWNTYFGTGDASSTGIAAGGIWTLKGSLIGLMDTMSNLECRPTFSVLPHFQRKYVESKFDCIVSIRIGQAMYALIKVIRKSSLKKEVYI